MSLRDRVDLKPEDRLPPADPQTMADQHMALLRTLSAAVDELAKTIQSWHEDPIGGQRRANARVLEVREMVDRAEGAGERLIKAKRLAGHFSHQYDGDLGAH